MASLNELKIGYVPQTPDLAKPGDRRRFVHYARARGIDFEVANPERTYDLVVLSQAADVSRWCRKTGPLIVYDLIDSYLAIPRNDLKGRFRGLAKYIFGQNRYLELDYWRALGAMCSRADAVICSTEEQRRDIQVFCKNTHVILDAHKEIGPPSKSGYVASTPFRLVWEGLPQTVTGLKIIAPVLQKMLGKRQIELVLITDPVGYRYLGRFGAFDTKKVAQRFFPFVTLIPWSADTLSRDISACDLAIIPLDLSDPFTSGKPENKLLLFWRLAMPVITSATPAYARAMSRAGLDMSCVNESEWEIMLNYYIESAEARCRAGRAGLDCASRDYSEEAIITQWDLVFESLVGESYRSSSSGSGQ